MIYEYNGSRYYVYLDDIEVKTPDGWKRAVLYKKDTGYREKGCVREYEDFMSKFKPLSGEQERSAFR